MWKVKKIKELNLQLFYLKNKKSCYLLDYDMDVFDLMFCGIAFHHAIPLFPL